MANLLLPIKHKSSGFTLIELIMVIVLLGVMAVGITGFIGLSTQTYINVSERDELLSTARFAVERLNREIRNAVPNSIRVKKTVFAGYDIQCIEFVPIVASTTYVDIPVSPEPPLVQLPVIPFVDRYGVEYSCPGSNCVQAVTVYPLTDTDIYNNPYDGTGKVFGIDSLTKSSANEWIINMDRSSGVLFDADSPTSRMYVINSPVSYCVASNRLFRYEYYGYAPSQLAPPIAKAVTMANDVVNMNVGVNPFTVIPASLQRNALVEVKLMFDRNGESIVFDNNIQVKNIP
jgi:MSHA biogenesis protein MshO